MKSYNHLYEEFISDENIRSAIIKSSKGKRKRKEVKKYFNDIEKSIPVIKDYASNFKNYNHKPIEIYDGISRKKRTIIVPKYKEQIVHHMIVNVLQSIFTKGMYEHSNGSIPKRGSHRGKKQIEKWIRKGGKDIKYCLKMDIKKYFDSIPHETLLKKLHLIIHDEKFMKILEELVNATEKGIPLGFYTSQLLANWYLQGLDHYIKEELKATYYMRYMDDIVIFGSNKKKLHKIQQSIVSYLSDKLGLTMKENWQVFRFHYMDKKTNKDKGRFLDFMGFRFYRNRTTLRKNIMLKMCRKARKIKYKTSPTIYDCKQMMSYVGWLNCTNTYDMYKEHIKPFVNIKQLKEKISKYDRKRNKERKESEVILCGNG